MEHTYYDYMKFNFQEFYELLKCLMTKQYPKFEVNDNNFSMFLVNRYISFYNPVMCQYINSIANKNGLLDVTNSRACFEYLFYSLPKMPYKFIKYIKKGVSDIARNKNITEEDIASLSYYHDISKREVLDNIEQLESLGKL